MDSQKTEKQIGSPSSKVFLRVLGVGTTAVLEGALLASCVSQRLSNPSISPESGVGPRPSEVPTETGGYEGLVLDGQTDLKFLTNIGKITRVSEYNGPQVLEGAVYGRFIQVEEVEPKNVDMIGFEVQTEQNKRAYVFLLVDNKDTSGKSDDTVYMAFREYKDAQGNMESVDFITEDNWVDNTNFTFVELSHELLPDGTPAFLIRGSDNSITPVVINKGGLIEYTFFTKDGQSTPMPPKTVNDIVYRLPSQNTPTAVAEPASEPTGIPELKEYKICTVENYLECPIPMDDLMDGSYLRWLKTLSKPFDPKVRNVPVQNWGGFIWYGSPKQFQDPLSNPFRIGPVGSLNIDGGEPGIVLSWDAHSDQAPDENKPLVFVMTRGTSSEEMWQEILHLLASSEYPMFRDHSDMEISKMVSPFREAYEMYPDMKERIKSFVETGDPFYLSDPGIILQASVVKN